MSIDENTPLKPPGPTLLWGAACSSVARANAYAESVHGSVYADHREDTAKLPFAALVTCVTDDMPALAEAADVGLYVICERIIKPGTAAIYGLFPMIANPQLDHTAADAHWRDVHAPLALQHHAAMTHYLQLSVTATISGTPFDGFALCGFDSLDDLKHRFFTTEASRQVIADDVASFADPKSSPRRLLAEVQTFVKK